MARTASPVITVDASAMLAIYLNEPERGAFLGALAAYPTVLSPVNHWEVLAKARRYDGSDGVDRIERLLRDLDITIPAMSAEDSRAAYEAFARFGKGVGGPLNLSDCFAYALAQAEGDGLLFKGDDFPRTDVKPALA